MYKSNVSLYIKNTVQIMYPTTFSSPPRACRNQSPLVTTSPLANRRLSPYVRSSRGGGRESGRSVAVAEGMRAGGWSPRWRSRGSSRGLWRRAGGLAYGPHGGWREARRAHRAVEAGGASHGPYGGGGNIGDAQRGRRQRSLWGYGCRNAE